jgi:adenosylcobinamide-GDP ribazoletransferase
MFVTMQRQIVLFLVATQFLTRLPTPAWRSFQPSWLAQAARYFPLVGVLVGSISVGVWWLAGRWLPAATSAGLAMAAALLVTGAFHEDGLADTCDGCGGGGTRDQVLEIMKDSRIGAYGAIGLCIVLGLKWTVYVAIPAVAFPPIVIGAHMVSRWCACGLMVRLPYVRGGDDAKSKPFADALRTRAWIWSGVLGAVAVAPFAWTADAALQLLLVRVLGAGVAAAAIAAALLAAYFRRRIGGYTGDCLGAVQQFSELGFLLAALAVVGAAMRAG